VSLESEEDGSLTSLAEGAGSVVCGVLPTVSAPLPATNSGEGPLEVDPLELQGVPVSDGLLPPAGLVPPEPEFVPPDPLFVPPDPLFVPPGLVPPDLVPPELFALPAGVLPCDSLPAASLPETDDCEEIADPPAGADVVTDTTSFTLYVLGVLWLALVPAGEVCDVPGAAEMAGPLPRLGAGLAIAGELCLGEWVEPLKVATRPVTPMPRTSPAIAAAMLRPVRSLELNTLCPSDPTPCLPPRLWRWTHCEWSKDRGKEVRDELFGTFTRFFPLPAMRLSTLRR